MLFYSLSFTCLDFYRLQMTLYLKKFIGPDAFSTVQSSGGILAEWCLLAAPLYFPSSFPHQQTLWHQLSSSVMTFERKVWINLQLFLQFTKRIQPWRILIFRESTTHKLCCNSFYSHFLAQNSSTGAPRHANHTNEFVNCPATVLLDPVHEFLWCLHSFGRSTVTLNAIGL